MNEDEKAAILAALRRMFEENIFPYGLAAESLARGAAREKAEAEYWNQFLPGHSGPSATVEVEPPGRTGLRIRYAPQPQGDLDAGEIVRTWVPSGTEGRGAYDSVLVIGQDSDGRLLSVLLSRTSHTGDHRYFPIGAGPKDAHGRFSWVDLDHFFAISDQGVHRTGFTIDRDHFIRVADELYGRYAWPMED
ncbi:type II toxin-antitoxin system PemK/MazF family toxin [Microbacterium candidum]|uniref:Type II toxin-antitoxin system PemK/MazF family toxin n=1 Tax=Microbacterium candidum TaxID=3041922 RepID=A0ABT7N3H5_9MICO|nr:type II toxin-antitoxin system PemK/MazF family toxin [Microbacterium sp. ASV49]MDL9981261.1 type II toxin-antitoxin system PemK/MazF family toxin [Microbacterium sp. ASV49]